MSSALIKSGKTGKREKREKVEKEGGRTGERKERKNWGLVAVFLVFLFFFQAAARKKREEDCLPACALPRRRRGPRCPCRSRRAPGAPPGRGPGPRRFRDKVHKSAPVRLDQDATVADKCNLAAQVGANEPGAGPLSCFALFRISQALSESLP